MSRNMTFVLFELNGICLVWDPSLVSTTVKSVRLNRETDSRGAMFCWLSGSGCLWGECAVAWTVK
jgi:hypothetical protein